MQLELDFEAGLTKRYPDWMDCIRAVAYACGHPLKRVAADAGAILVTTEKDAVRLPAGITKGTGADVRILTTTIEWEDPAALQEALEPLLTFKSCAAHGQQ